MNPSSPRRDGDSDNAFADLYRHWIKSAEEEKGDPERQATTEEREHLTAFAVSTNALRRLGWQPMRSCPKGTTVRLISIGSSGVCPGRVDEDGCAWAFEAGDIWPIQPVLWKDM